MRALVAARALLERLISVPQALYPDPALYWRARTIRVFVVANFGVWIVQLLYLALFGERAALLRGLTIGPTMLTILGATYWLTRHGRRGLLLANLIVLPLLVVLPFVWGMRHSGLFDPVSPGLFFTMVFTGLFLGARSAAVTTALCFAALVALGWATATGRIGDASIAAPPSAVETFLLSMLTSTVNIGVMLILWDRLHRNLLDAALAHDRRSQAAQQRADALAELARVRTRLFNDISHELRTPLTLSLGSLEESLEDAASPLAPPQRERLLLARRNNLRLLKLVNTILDMARIEAGRGAPVLQAMDLAQRTAELCAEFRSAARSRGLQLTVRCAPARAAVDPEMWEKIVLNLLSNALKFTAAGEIDVSLQAEGGRVRLAVRDTGCGISEADQAHLFERFRAPRGPSSFLQEGSGLGLALVRELVQLQGGALSVESRVGVGSTFTAELPALAPDGPSPAAPPPRSDRAARYLDELERLGPAAAPDPGAPPAGAPEVLVVEDDGDMRAYLGRLLGRRYRLRLTAGAAEALREARRAPPDLILTDVMMPGTDGLALLRELRGDDRLRLLPVLLLSARAGADHVAEALAAGADDYLSKPFSARELLARVEAHLSHARQRLAAATTLEGQLSLIVHELRGPLSVVSCYSQLLRDRPGPDPAMLQRLLGGARQLQRLLQDLGEAAHLRDGGTSLIRERFDLRTLCQEAAELRAASGATAALRVDLPAEPVEVEGDPIRVAQVLDNLLDNARKYAPGATVSLSLRREAGEALLSVRDEGPGIAPEHQARLFERFYRAPGADWEKGLGLGLYLCRELVERHGGRIEVDSALGRGTTFRVALPL